MQKKDKILLSRINNLLGGFYSNFEAVDWYDFFIVSSSKPYSNFNHQSIILDVVQQLSKDITQRQSNDNLRVDIMDSYIRACYEQLTDSDIDWIITMVTDNFANRYPNDYNAKAVVNLLATVIECCNVKDYHIEKILTYYKDDRHGFKNVILNALIDSDELNKVLIETYIDDFTMNNWRDISRMNLWNMYNYDLFSAACPISEYINYRELLRHNPIPVPIVYSLFMNDTSFVKSIIDFNLPTFKFEDGWLFIFKYYQFGQHQLSKIMTHYKGTEHEHDIFFTILGTQYVDENTLNSFKDVILANKHLAEKYECLVVKNTFANRLLKKKSDKALKKYLTTQGFEIKKDINGEYIDAACIAMNCYYENTATRYLRVLEKAPEALFKTEFTVPRDSYFVIGNDSNADQFRVYLNDICIDLSRDEKTVIKSKRIIKI